MNEKPKCKECGGDNVIKRFASKWDMSKQQWNKGQFVEYDCSKCGQCEIEWVDCCEVCNTELSERQVSHCSAYCILMGEIEMTVKMKPTCSRCGNEDEDRDNAWEFVERYYPNYTQSDAIAYNDDLLKLIHEEDEEGSSARELRKQLEEAYPLLAHGCWEEKNDILFRIYNESRAEIYRTAIEAYMEGGTKSDPVPDKNPVQGKRTTIHLLVRDNQDFDNDSEVCDFLSETMRNLPEVIDWGYADRDRPTWVEYASDDYKEGDFLELEGQNEA